jgi:hypothetical protein
VKPLLALFLLGAGVLAAVQHNGSVRAADQFIPGATVTAVQGGAKVVAYTDENGRYSIELTPGVWRLQVEMFGFQPAVRTLDVGLEESTIDWTLEVPRAGEQVIAAAPMAAATSAKAQPGGFRSTIVKATDAGTQALAEASAAPVPPDSGNEASESFVVAGSVSGGLARAADDQARRDRQPPQAGRGNSGGGSATADMAALSAGGNLADSMGLGGFGAQGFSDNNGNRGGGGGGRGGNIPGGGGRGGRGGPAANSFTSIGNKRKDRPTYTGSVSATSRNSALDARPFSLNGQNAAKPSYRQNNVSAQLGGPLRIPKIYSGDRLMFFVTYQASRARNPYSALSTMPSADERAGDFSQAVVRGNPVTIYDPFSGSPFPGNIIPLTRFNPAAAGLLKYFPTVTYPSLTVQNYQIVTSSKASSDTFGTRQNLPLTRKDRLNFAFNYQRSSGLNPTLFGFHDASESSSLSGQAGWSHSFKPRFNSSLNWNFSRSIAQAAPYFAYGSNVAAQLGIAGTTQDPITWGPPNLSFTNFGGLSDGSASLNRNQTSAVSEGLTWVYKRKHNLTFGAGYRRQQQNPLSYSNARGSFSFSGLLTSGLDANGNPIPATGLDFADFLLGYPQSSSLQLGAKADYFRSWTINWYAQDDWRVTPSLSFNVGLRYEYFSPFSELFGRMANLDLNSTITAAAVVTPGQNGPYSGGLPTSLVRPDTNNYSPRYGFAWKPSAKKPLMFRGGYSIFFNGGAYGGFASRMAAQPPFIHTASLSTSLADPLTLQNGFAVAPSQTITNTYAIDPNYRLGYAQTWTFAVQQNLPLQSMVELEYIGTKGTALDILRQPNRAAPGSPLTAAERLQIGNATGFTLETSQGSSIMHMAQVRLTRRMVRGIAMTATYAFQKSIDNASNVGGSGGGVIAQNDQNLRLERGLSSFDQRHHLNLQYTLTSPVGGARGFFRGRGLPRKLLENWTLSGGFDATSGKPLTARVSGALVNTGGTAAFGTGRAEASGLPIGGSPYFNLLAFTLPPAGQYGDAGRNTIPGLFQTALNASFGRAFRLGADSKRTLQARLNANNAFNHITITNIGTTVNSATYGLPAAASGTRTVSMTMRFNF